jgi:hypothetical protein
MVIVLWPIRSRIVMRSTDRKARGEGVSKVMEAEIFDPSGSQGRRNDFLGPPEVTSP